MRYGLILILKTLVLLPYLFPLRNSRIVYNFVEYCELIFSYLKDLEGGKTAGKILLRP